MNLENVLREGSESQKVTQPMILFLCCCNCGLVRAWLGRQGGETTADEHGVSFWGDENVLELSSGGGCTIS